MKAALVLRGGPLVPDLAKAGRYGITRFYWEYDDPNLSFGFLESFRPKGLQVGIMAVPRGESAVDFARNIDAALIKLGMTSRQCAVIADVEAHDPRYVVDFLTEWRDLRPTRETAWTMEPFQGGWFSPNLLGKINLDPYLTLLPQNYLGDMTPCASDQVRSDLVNYGVANKKIQSFYGPTRADHGWQGVIFDFIQLA